MLSCSQSSDIHLKAAYNITWRPETKEKHCSVIFLKFWEEEVTTNLTTLPVTLNKLRQYVIRYSFENVTNTLLRYQKRNAVSVTSLLVTRYYRHGWKERSRAYWRVGEQCLLLTFLLGAGFNDDHKSDICPVREHRGTFPAQWQAERPFHACMPSPARRLDQTHLSTQKMRDFSRRDDTAFLLRRQASAPWPVLI